MDTGPLKAARVRRSLEEALEDSLSEDRQWHLSLTPEVREAFFQEKEDVRQIWLLWPATALVILVIVIVYLTTLPTQSE